MSNCESQDKLRGLPICSVYRCVCVIGQVVSITYYFVLCAGVCVCVCVSQDRLCGLPVCSVYRCGDKL